MRSVTGSRGPGEWVGPARRGEKAAEERRERLWEMLSARRSLCLRKASERSRLVVSPDGFGGNDSKREQNYFWGEKHLFLPQSHSGNSQAERKGIKVSRVFSGSGWAREEQQELMHRAVLGTGLASPSGGIIPQLGGQLLTVSFYRYADFLTKLVVFSESHILNIYKNLSLLTSFSF